MAAHEGSMAARIFLGLSAPIGFFADAAGVTFTSPTGATDMRATYGGLTTAIGGIALTGALRPAFARQALVVLAAVGAGLGGARLIGAGLDGALTAWTVQALVFELGTVALGAWLLRRA